MQACSRPYFPLNCDEINRQRSSLLTNERKRVECVDEYTADNLCLYVTLNCLQRLTDKV